MIKTDTITKTIDGKTLVVTLTRGLWDDEVNLDGHLCGVVTRRVNRTEISLFDGNKKLASGTSLEPLPQTHRLLADAVKAGCVGIVGREWFVRPNTAEAIRSALAELETMNPKSAKQIKIEEEKATAAADMDAWLNSDEHQRMVKFAADMDNPDSDF